MKHLIIPIKACCVTMDIVSWTFEHEELDSEAPIYIDVNDSTRSISTRQVRTLVRQLVSGFHNHGVKKGDCICVISFNDIHYTSLYLGIIGSGACFTGANPGYTGRELAHHVKITGSKILLTELKTLPVALEAAEECGISHSNVFVLNYQDEAVPSPHQSWNSLLSHGENDWAKIEDPSTPAAFVSTSGTSGLPKAAILPHSYLISQGNFQETMIRKDEKISSLIAVPPFHVFTMPVQHALPLRTGSPAYIMPRFDEGAFVRALGEFNVTQTIVVPPILMALTKRSSSELVSLRKIFVGGSVATYGMQQQLYSKLSPEAKIVQVYGMTEVGWATAWTKGAKDETGSVGQALPGARIRLMATDGRAIEKDSTTGEVQIHTPTSMKGYLNNAAATTEAFTSDGWVRTGDIGYVKDGNWYIIDRTKDLIKVRGWQVSPAEIEAALLEHPDIVDAGVIGVPAADGCGQSPAAFIKKKENSELELKDVRTFLAVRLARYKNVEKVEFVDTIPRNPTGKILRRILRDTRIPDVVTKDMLAAQKYATELKKLEAYNRSRTSMSLDLERSDMKTQDESVTEIDIESDRLKQSIEQIEIPCEPSRKSRKRKCCPASPLEYLRKLRCGIRGRG
ncbi:acetyl-CoA synthetase-like protein [Mollisia scopiformis]|uniref:Acetyl-CoA synthetase-like protein n=1 Tax=Mollisia scopiformis TaxID=149040 RepID=A0A194XU20_MOLSC|nr:acetyl-CoA synthetase-like protein [Mollisia scopiformis]KUJ23636.1 acetyl-CoA synthetase-like protein [Mollisia scopiformis]